jgi:hypothetical protein
MKKLRLIIKGRVTNASIYFDIAQDNYDAYLSLKTELREQQMENTPDIRESDLAMMITFFDNVQDEGMVTFPSSLFVHDLIRLRKDAEKRRIQAIVFAHFCLEAFIYDYAIYAIGNECTREHIEGMPFLMKWLFIPKFCSGRTFNKGKSKAWELLRRLNTERNNYAHCKSKTLRQHCDQMKRIFDKSSKERQQPEDLNPTETVCEVLTELKKCESEAGAIIEPSGKPIKILQWELK